MSNDIVKEMNLLLADEMVFYQKLRNFPWNVRGPAFFQLHTKFEEMYTASSLTVDQIAERIRALGGRPLSTMKEFLDSSRISEQSDVPSANHMVGELQSDLEKLVEFTNGLRKSAGNAGDDTTVALMDDLADAHEQDAWMLKAWLG
jgi:starvation-inducible DNA-binding protein